MKQQLNVDLLEVGDNYFSKEGLGLVLVTLKNGKKYKAVPDVFLSITGNLYVSCIVGITSININLNNIIYSDDGVFNNLMIDIVREQKIKRILNKKDY